MCPCFVWNTNKVNVKDEFKGSFKKPACWTSSQLFKDVEHMNSSSLRKATVYDTGVGEWYEGEAACFCIDWHESAYSLCELLHALS